MVLCPGPWHPQHRCGRAERKTRCPGRVPWAGRVLAPRPSQHSALLALALPALGWKRQQAGEGRGGPKSPNMAAGRGRGGVGEGRLSAQLAVALSGRGVLSVTQAGAAPPAGPACSVHVCGQYGTRLVGCLFVLCFVALFLICFAFPGPRRKQLWCHMVPMLYVAAGPMVWWYGSAAAYTLP